MNRLQMENIWQISECCTPQAQQGAIPGHWLLVPVIQLSGNIRALTAGLLFWHLTVEGSLSISSKETCKRPLQRKVIWWQDNKCDTLGEEPCSLGDDPYHPPRPWVLEVPAVEGTAWAAHPSAASVLLPSEVMAVPASASLRVCRWPQTHHQSISRGTSQGLETPCCTRLSKEVHLGM